MFAVLVYDIPSHDGGLKRRNRIFKICRKYGFHVQASVFELDIDAGELLHVEHEISKVLDAKTDSVRVYHLGKRRTDTNVVCLGKREVIETSDSAFIF